MAQRLGSDVGKLPILMSVPHAGLGVPYCVVDMHQLTDQEIAADGDVGAAEVYDLAEHVEQWISTDIARAFVDLNRAPDDFRKDGVVKTHTCWDVPIYRQPLTEQQVAELLAKHYHPYHAALSKLAGTVKIGVDAHTMAAEAPPVAPDRGTRPLVCIGDGNGACPRDWAERLRDCCAAEFPGPVTINEPFAGGYVTRHHGQEMPWVQVEMSRDPALSTTDKRRRFLAALQAWVVQL